jgi:hypothetical protein
LSMSTRRILWEATVTVAAGVQPMWQSQTVQWSRRYITIFGSASKQ